MISTLTLHPLIFAKPHSQHDRNMLDETMLALMSTGNNLLSAALQQPPAFRSLMAALPPSAVVRLLCYMTAHKAYNRAGGEQQDPMSKAYSKKGNSLALEGPLLRLYEHYHLTNGKYDVEPTVSELVFQSVCLPQLFCCPPEFPNRERIHYPRFEC